MIGAIGMGVRLGVWVVALVLGLLVAVAVPEGTFPGVRPLTLGVVFLAVGGVGHAWLANRSRRPLGVGRPRDRRPADGVIDVAAVAGVSRVLNPVDPRFGSFDPGGPVDTAAVGGFVGSRDRVGWPMLGRLVLVSVFAGMDGRAWSVGEVAAAHEALRRAGAWLEREAGRWGAALNVELADTYFVHEETDPDRVEVEFSHDDAGDASPFERDAALKAVSRLTRAAVGLGFRDAAAMTGRIGSRLDADLTAWLLHPRQAGRSFAATRDLDLLGGLSLAVCYPKEASFPEPLRGGARVDPVTVVHEILHLFGATDRYGRPADGDPEALTTAGGCDVMRLDQNRLSRLRVEAWTAREIGWQPAKPVG